MKYAQWAFEIAEKTLNKRGTIRANRLMGEIYLAIREYTRAEEKLREALANAKKAGNPPHLWKTYFTLGQLNEARGLDSEAKKKYREAFMVTERLSWTLTDKSLRNIFLNSDQVVRIRDSLQKVQ
jgi:tetratricopeptide (TPR) repeat protein